MLSVIDYILDNISFYFLLILLGPNIVRNSYKLYLFFQFSYSIFLSYNILNSNLASNNLGELTNIKTYTTTDNLFTCPSDGYIALSTNYGTSNYVLTTIYSADKTSNFGFGVNGHPTISTTNAIFVKKGMHVLYRGAVGLNYAVFYPFSQ